MFATISASCQAAILESLRCGKLCSCGRTTQTHTHTHTRTKNARDEPMAMITKEILANATNHAAKLRRKLGPVRLCHGDGAYCLEEHQHSSTDPSGGPASSGDGNGAQMPVQRWQFAMKHARGPRQPPHPPPPPPQKRRRRKRATSLRAQLRPRGAMPRGADRHHPKPSPSHDLKPCRARRSDLKPPPRNT